MKAMTKYQKYSAAVATHMERLRYKRLSPATIRNYQRTYDAFGEFLLSARENGSTDDADVSFSDVSAWADALANSGAKVSTINQYLTRLGVLFNRAARPTFPEPLRYAENPVDADLFGRIDKAPYDDLLDDADVARLFRNKAPHGFERFWARNYAMIQILLSEKLRNAELLDLRLEDIDFEHSEIIVQRGKGGKYRVVDMSDNTAAAIRLYIASGIRPLSAQENDYLFGTTAPHAMGARTNDDAIEWHRGTTQWLSDVVERTVYAITGVDHIRSHDLRHIGARLDLNSGVSLEQLQSELGHTNPAVTERYSGRLKQRRRRDSARAVLDMRDEWARLNEARLESIRL